jgi:parallel beta-helix repeat protein
VYPGQKVSGEEEPKMKRVKIRLLSVLCLIFALSLLPTLPAKASATIYVPDNYTTIQAAVNAASPGDTIVVRDGTYTENINVNKSLTIQSEHGADATTVQAANPDDHVFGVTADYVNIIGFTVKGAINCYGIHLISARYCTVFKNEIWNNCVGICMVDSSKNKISYNEVNDNEGDIKLTCSNGNTFTGNILGRSNCGIEIWENCSYNTLIKNVVYNNKVGISLGSWHVPSNYNDVYLNNFIQNDNNCVSLSGSTNTWNSSEEITYTYNRNTRTNYLGNYWSDYTGRDANKDGIGDAPYTINSDKDTYPLMQPFENYLIGITYVGQYTATAYAYPEEADKRFGSSNAPRIRIQINKQDSSIIYVNVKKRFYSAMTMNGGGLVNDNPQHYTHLVRWTLVGSIFEEIDEVVGSQGRPLIPYQSIAIWPTEKLGYGDKGYFIVVGTNKRFQFTADDTCPAARGKNQIDVWLGVGSAAYVEAFRWGRKLVDVYK